MRHTHTTYFPGLVELLSEVQTELLVYEGLITTHPLEISVRTLKNKLNDTGWIKKINDTNTIQLQLKTGLNIDYVNGIIKLIDNLGWFISKIESGVDDNGVIKNWNYKYSIEFLNKVLKTNYTKLILILEAKYDIEVMQEKIPEYVYHITTEEIWNSKISKIGLIPKSKKKLGNHPDRIYLSNSKEGIINLARKLQFFIGNVNYVILKIETEQIPHFRLFNDPNYQPNGYYTLNNISKDYISIDSKIEK